MKNFACLVRGLALVAVMAAGVGCDDDDNNPAVDGGTDSGTRADVGGPGTGRDTGRETGTSDTGGPIIPGGNVDATVSGDSADAADATGGSDATTAADTATTTDTATSADGRDGGRGRDAARDAPPADAVSFPVAGNCNSPAAGICSEWEATAMAAAALARECTNRFGSTNRPCDDDYYGRCITVTGAAKVTEYYYAVPGRPRGQREAQNLENCGDGGGIYISEPR